LWVGLCGAGALARGLLFLFRLPGLCLPESRDEQKYQNQSKNRGLGSLAISFEFSH